MFFPCGWYHDMYLTGCWTGLLIMGRQAGLTVVMERETNILGVHLAQNREFFYP
jgi:hypothetical protein